MGLRDIVGKFRDVVQARKVSTHRGLTPDEVELASYKRREYLDNVKKEVGRYRKVDTNQMFAGSTFDHSNTILGSQKKRKGIRGGTNMRDKNVFWR